MTISTYADLKAQVALFLNRTDLTAQIPVFIQFAEERINYGSMEPPFVTDPLRSRDMEVNATATFAAQRVALPTDFLERRRIYIILADGTKQELDYLPPAQFWDTRAASITGRPVCFTIEGGEFVLGPTPDLSYTGALLYYKKITALSADGDTNWLLVKSPGAYLAGALIDGWEYLLDENNAEVAHKRFVGRINALNNAERQASHGGTPWIGRSDLSNP